MHIPEMPVEVTYVGGPTAIIEVAGLRMITDPTFSAPGKYPSGAVTLEKTEGPAVTVEAAGPLDLVLLSHDQHADNFDPAGRTLAESVPTLTTVSGAGRLGSHSEGLRPWEWREFAAKDGRLVKVTATPARHGPAGIEPIAGDVIGFVISLVDPAVDLVYMTGDTVWYDGVAEVARRFDPAVVLLFAGAARTRGPFHLTMSTNDAVETAAAFPRATIVPVHHAGWAHFTQSQEDLVKTFAVVGMADRLRTVVPGERLLLRA